jgi:hypothetical protein
MVCKAIDASQAKTGRFDCSGQSDGGHSDDKGLGVGVDTGDSGRNIEMASGKKTMF